LDRGLRGGGCTGEMALAARGGGVARRARRHNRRRPSRRAAATSASAEATVRAFEFASATRIVFGCNTAVQAVEDFVRSSEGVRSVLLVTGSDPSRASAFVSALESAGAAVQTFALPPGEPTVGTAGAALEAGRACGANAVVSVGGGSAIDTGKAVAGLLPQPGGLMDYMEVVGRGQPLTERSLPFVAVPTTAGTGAEVTKNSVFDDPEANVKASIRSNLMLPAVAVVDPTLTLGCPPALTAATGLDALIQCLEPYVCNVPNPIVDAISMEGLRRAARALVPAYRDGSNLAAREDMCVASLCGGLSLANAKLGAVHGFAGPLGGMLHGPHGALCAAMLPAAMEINVRALKQGGARVPAGSDALQRYDVVAKVLTGDLSAEAHHAVDLLRDVVKELGVPGLASYGMTEERIPEAVEKGLRSSSMKGNPVPLTEEELAELLRSSL